MNYLLSIFDMEWAILMEKAHQSGQGLGNALTYIFSEIIYSDVKFLYFHKFNNILT